jgi:hypothetical protein
MKQTEPTAKLKSMSNQSICPFRFGAFGAIDEKGGRGPSRHDQSPDQSDWYLFVYPVLERLQKRNHLLLLFVRQVLEVVNNMRSLIPVTRNRVFQRQGSQVVHEARFDVQAPEGNGSQLMGSVCRPGLYDAVPRPNVMQEEIPERVDDLVPERGRDRIRPAIDNSSWRGCDHRRHMANRAADVFEELGASLRIQGLREIRLAGRRHGSADELRKVIDIGQAEIVWNVLRIGGDLANGCHIFGPQPVRHAHFVQVCIR